MCGHPELDLDNISPPLPIAGREATKKGVRRQVAVWGDSDALSLPFRHPFGASRVKVIRYLW
jgi:hypothetical protein